MSHVPIITNNSSLSYPVLFRIFSFKNTFFHHNYVINYVHVQFFFALIFLAVWVLANFVLSFNLLAKCR